MNARIVWILVLVALVATTGCGVLPTPTGEELAIVAGYAGRVAQSAEAAATATAEAQVSGSQTPTVAVTMTVSNGASNLATLVAAVSDTPTATVTPTLGAANINTSTSGVTAADTITSTLEVVTGTLYSVTGASASVPAPVEDLQNYSNTLGLDTYPWLAEPGVLTADSLADCAGNASCWPISPDRQYVLVGREAVSSVREDGWTLISSSGGTFEVNGTIVKLQKREGHLWLLLIKGLRAGPGDLNVPLAASEYDAGFTLVTHLPVGARVSEQYFLDQVSNGLSQGNCGNDGCEAVSAFFFDLNTGAWTSVHLSSVGGVWEQMGTNFVPSAP